MDDNHGATLFTSSVSCGTPSFSNGVTVEPFSSTTVGSEIVYECQSGRLPEGRRISVCGEDGRWYPDANIFMCEGQTYACYSVGITMQLTMIASTILSPSVDVHDLIGLTVKLHFSCSKLCSTKTSCKWNYCKLY